MTFNDITKDAAFYTTTSRFVAWLGAFSQERQGLWLPKDDLKDSSSWSSHPLVAHHPAQPGARARPGRDSQDGVSQQQEAAPLFLPQLDRLSEANVRGEDASNVAVIPGSQQIIGRWQPSKDLKQTFAVSRRAEQLRLHSQQRIVATVEDSALRTEMAALESQEEHAPRGSCGISLWVFSG